MGVQNSILYLCAEHLDDVDSSWSLRSTRTTLFCFCFQRCFRRMYSHKTVKATLNICIYRYIFCLQYIGIPNLFVPRILFFGTFKSIATRGVRMYNRISIWMKPRRKVLHNNHRTHTSTPNCVSIPHVSRMKYTVIRSYRFIYFSLCTVQTYFVYVSHCTNNVIQADTANETRKQ